MFKYFITRSADFQSAFYRTHATGAIKYLIMIEKKITQSKENFRLVVMPQLGVDKDLATA
jgi:hypothetical protein